MLPDFPDSIEQIKKKLKITDGGNNYLFATRNLYDKLILMVTEKAELN
ncbi:MAG: hypothetical protein KJZ55_05260 [Flavobacteriales bacterium]|nr:hypothetical protein [Flavobacteriales bacterium]